MTPPPSPAPAQGVHPTGRHAESLQDYRRNRLVQLVAMLTLMAGAVFFPGGSMTSPASVAVFAALAGIFLVHVVTGRRTRRAFLGLGDPLSRRWAQVHALDAPVDLATLALLSLLLFTPEGSNTSGTLVAVLAYSALVVASLIRSRRLAGRPL